MTVQCRILPDFDPMFPDVINFLFRSIQEYFDIRTEFTVELFTFGIPSLLPLTHYVIVLVSP